MHVGYVPTSQSVSTECAIFVKFNNIELLREYSPNLTIIFLSFLELVAFFLGSIA
jgi:hypothetical protein